VRATEAQARTAASALERKLGDVGAALQRGPGGAGAWLAAALPGAEQTVAVRHAKATAAAVQAALERDAARSGELAAVRRQLAGVVQRQAGAEQRGGNRSNGGGCEGGGKRPLGEELRLVERAGGVC
jgi:hypothetical protein